MKVGCVKEHFFDSGAFALWSKADAYARQTGKSKWEFYNTPEFWDYLEAYADFVKRYRKGIDLYCNIDVIPNPELSLRNLRELEKRGCKPVPVVHYTTDVKWLDFYIREGYEMVGIGGLVGSTRSPACRSWLDDAFHVICDSPDKLPRIKVHGFGVTSRYLYFRYPWWSIDSSGWAKAGGAGIILMPGTTKDKWDFEKSASYVVVSDSRTGKESAGKLQIDLEQEDYTGTYEGMPAPLKSRVKEWLRFIGVPLGKTGKEGNIIKAGVRNDYKFRHQANLMYFKKMSEAVPPYPWPFLKPRRASFGLF